MPCRSYTRRIIHPYFPADQPQNATEEQNGFWPLFLNFVDHGKQVKSKQLPPKEQKPTSSRRCPAVAVCKILKSPIDPVHTVVEINEGLFCISIPVGKDFKPENLDVAVKDRVVIVEIKIEQTSQDGSSQLNQVFTKKIALIDEVKVEDIKSRLTPEGVLKIEAPLPVPEQPPKPQATEIPVTLDYQNGSSSLQS